MSSISLSFVQSACCQQQQQVLFNQPRPPLISSKRVSVIVEAAGRMRQYNRQARHARIRKKKMEKQHGVNIMAVDGSNRDGFGRGRGGGRWSGKSRDGNERVQRDAMFHVTGVANNLSGK